MKLGNRRRGLVGVLVAVAGLLVGVGVPSAGARSVSVPAGGIVREPVTFSVVNPLAPGAPLTVRGELVRPSAGCAGSVLLALHGLSYAAWAWDFPLDDHRYSVAQALAGRGYALVTIDEPGYGNSTRPNGYTLTIPSYAAITAQIAQQLRTGSYKAPGAATRFAHVGLIGHSAGSEIIEMTAGLYPGVADVVIPTGYTHEPFVDNTWLAREWSTDNLRAATSDYEYFETNPATRAADMYNLANADPAVVRWDNAHANLTPSGEVFSIGAQESRALLARITVPLLLVLGGRDALFPGSQGAGEMLLFATTPDKTLVVAPNDGHVFMLQRDAPATFTVIADWLDRHNSAFPKC